MSKELVRQVLGYCCRIPVIRATLTTLIRIRNRNSPWMRRHPFDISYGTVTNGELPPWLLRSGEMADAHVIGYAGCQPSCLRVALKAISQPEDYTFVDFGCGKGRALVVASELPFRRIVGIELAPALVTIARRNAATLQKTTRNGHVSKYLRVMQPPSRLPRGIS